jgi:hypothetical protein
MSITWNQVGDIDSPVTMSPNNGYIYKGSNSMFFVLPESCSAGDIMRIAVSGTSEVPWSAITQNSDQSISFTDSDGNDHETTVGISGSLGNGPGNFSCVELLCTDDDTTWVVSNYTGILSAN